MLVRTLSIWIYFIFICNDVQFRWNYSSRIIWVVNISLFSSSQHNFLIHANHHLKKITCEKTVGEKFEKSLRSKVIVMKVSACAGWRLSFSLKLRFVNLKNHKKLNNHGFRSRLVRSSKKLWTRITPLVSVISSTARKSSEKPWKLLKHFP